MVLNAHHKLFRNRGVLQRALTVGVVVADRLAVAGSLGDADGARDRHLKELVGVVLLQLALDLRRQVE